MLTEQDITVRKPVWTALSDLWLDGELRASDLDRIADILIKSDYSLDILYKIYAQEVAPVVYQNLRQVAGEWGGFDEQWLHQEIISSIAARTSLSAFFLRLRQGFILNDSKADWNELERRIRTTN